TCTFYFANNSDLPVDLDAYVFHHRGPPVARLSWPTWPIKPPESAAPHPHELQHRPRQQSAASLSSRQAALLSVMNDSCPNYNLRRRLFGADDTAFHWRRRLQLKPSVAPGAAIPDASQQKSVLPFDPRELDAPTTRSSRPPWSAWASPTVRTGSGPAAAVPQSRQCRVARTGSGRPGLYAGYDQLGAMTVNKNEQMQHPPNFLYCPIPASSRTPFNATILVSASTETQVGPSQFGPPMSVTGESHLGYLLWPSRPGGIDGCTLESLDPLPRLSASRPMPWLLVLRRGGCLFVQRGAQRRSTSLSSEQVLFAMSSDGGPNVTLPAVFTFSRDARNLLDLALFFSGPAPIVLAGRKLSRERLSEHWESVQGLLDGQYSGLTVTQSYSVHTEPDSLPGAGGFSCSTSWSQAGVMQLTVSLDPGIAEIYKADNLTLYWQALESRLIDSKQPGSVLRFSAYAQTDLGCHFLSGILLGCRAASAAVCRQDWSGSRPYTAAMVALHSEFIAGCLFLLSALMLRPDGWLEAGILAAGLAVGRGPAHQAGLLGRLAGLPAALLEHRLLGSDWVPLAASCLWSAGLLSLAAFGEQRWDSTGVRRLLADCAWGCCCCTGRGRAARLAQCSGFGLYLH
uniref:PKD_channel domain-containing protein n=1 Tax=Macrostomum lignano TaxID=282301 RepID=A0A1I8JMY1_9PLAT